MWRKSKINSYSLASTQWWLSKMCAGHHDAHGHIYCCNLLTSLRKHIDLKSERCDCVFSELHPRQQSGTVRGRDAHRPPLQYPSAFCRLTLVWPGRARSSLSCESKTSLSQPPPAASPGTRWGVPRPEIISRACPGSAPGPPSGGTQEISAMSLSCLTSACLTESQAVISTPVSTVEITSVHSVAVTQSTFVVFSQFYVRRCSESNCKHHLCYSKIQYRNFLPQNFTHRKKWKFASSSFFSSTIRFY